MKELLNKGLHDQTSQSYLPLHHLFIVSEIIKMVHIKGWPDYISVCYTYARGTRPFLTGRSSTGRILEVHTTLCLRTIELRVTGRLSTLEVHVTICFVLTIRGGTLLNFEMTKTFCHSST